MFKVLAHRASLVEFQNLQNKYIQKWEFLQGDRLSKEAKICVKQFEEALQALLTGDALAEFKQHQQVDAWYPKIVELMVVLHRADTRQLKSQNVDRVAATAAQDAGTALPMGKYEPTRHTVVRRALRKALLHAQCLMLDPADENKGTFVYKWRNDPVGPRLRAFIASCERYYYFNAIKADPEASKSALMAENLHQMNIGPAPKRPTLLTVRDAESQILRDSPPNELRPEDQFGQEEQMMLVRSLSRQALLNNS